MKLHPFILEFFEESFELSRNEIVKLFNQKGLYINNTVISDPDRAIGEYSDWRIIGEDKWIGFMLGVGKKKRVMYCLQKVSDEGPVEFVDITNLSDFSKLIKLGDKKLKDITVVGATF